MILVTVVVVAVGSVTGLTGRVLVLVLAVVVVVVVCVVVLLEPDPIGLMIGGGGTMTDGDTGVLGSVVTSLS